jgi:hypothetical protein
MLVVAFATVSPIVIAEDDENKKQALKEKIVNYLSKRNNTKIKIKELWENRDQIKERIKNSNLTEEEKQILKEQAKKLKQKI